MIKICQIYFMLEMYMTLHNFAAGIPIFFSELFLSIPQSQP